MMVAAGWSPAARSFRALVFASDRMFDPFEPVGVFSQPGPLDAQPSELEEEQYRRLGSLRERSEAAWFAGRPPLQAPRNTADWVQLGRRVREQRALIVAGAHGLKVAVGGALHLTTLKLGEQTTRRVHRFDDTGDQLARLVAGTRYPVAMAAPCECGSGRLMAGCHGSDPASGSAQP